jgi:long-subunit fatty acid transport protein
MRSNRSRRSLGLWSIAAVTLAVVSLAPSLAMAGGFHISIIGTRRNAMLTNLAAPDDMTALFHNPAGLADRRGYRFHLFGSMNFLDNEFEVMALDPDRFPEINPAGCGEGDNDPCPWPVGDDGYYLDTIGPESSFGILPFIGFSTDLGFIDQRFEDVVFSVGAYAPNLYGGTLSSEAPTRYFMTSGYFAVISATAGIGWRINDYVSIGGHISYNYMRMKYGFRLSTIDVLVPEGEEPDSLSRIVQDAYGDIDLAYVGEDHGVGWSIGLLIRPTDWMSIGLSYLVSSTANFEGDLDLYTTRPDSNIDDFAMFGYALPERLEVEMPIPPAIGFGLNFTPAEWLEVGLDLRLWLYNMYKHQRMTPIYAPDAPGRQPMTEESLSRDKDNTLSFELALGALFRPFSRFPCRFRTLELMAGIGYDHSPVSDESFSLDNPSMSQIVVGAGLRWPISDHVRIGLAYMLLVYLRRDITTSETSPPTNVRGQGLNHIPSLEIEAAF